MLRGLVYLVVLGSGCTLFTPGILARCGDGFFNEGEEECDDGNQNPNDGCDPECLLEVALCGNGVIDSGEACDDGNTTDADGCTALCVVEGVFICGNGLEEPGEECDDGNQTNGDGCDNNCTVTLCGNGIITGAEQCDGGNPNTNPFCNASCAFVPSATCNDTVSQVGEFCGFTRFDINIGSGTNSVQLEDLNGDSQDDIAVSADDGSVRVFLRNGGSFDAPTLHSVGAKALAMIAEDLNEDGFSDLLVEKFGGEVVALFNANNNIPANFRVEPLFDLDASGLTPATGDLNDDGTLDLIVGSNSTNQVFFSLGISVGVFATPVAFFDPIEGTSSVVVLDADEDGIDDVIAAGFLEDGVRLYPSNGALGTALLPVGDGPSTMVKGDFDERDSEEELIVSLFLEDRLQVIEVSKGSLFLESKIEVGENPTGLALGDMNNDGHLDVVVLHFNENNPAGADDSIGILFGDGLGGFGGRVDFAVGIGGASVALGFLNPDNALDVATANTLGGDISLLFSAPR